MVFFTGGQGAFRDRPKIWGEEWRLGIIPRPLEQVFSQPRELKDIQWLEQPWPNGYACDPWLVEDENSKFLFFEFFDRETKRGCIGMAPLTHEGQWRLENPIRIIQEPYHLSHPCLFSYRGRWFMIPEGADSGEITLYEAIRFPDVWGPKRTLIPDFPGLDPIFFEWQHQCWLFCTRKGASQESELYLFHSSDLTGPWKPHKSNPIGLGPRRSRPAGPIIQRDGALVRPGQDSRFTYGQSVVFSQLDQLGPQFYHEQEIMEIKAPRWGTFRHGIHSVTFGQDMTIVDGKRFTGLKALFGPGMVQSRQFFSRFSDPS